MNAVCQKKGFPFVEYLLKIGSDIDAVNNNNQTAIMMACHWKRKAMIKLLLSYYPDLNIMGGQKTHHLTALSSCLFKNHYDIAKILLFRGADPNLVRKSEFIKFLDEDHRKKIKEFLRPYIRWQKGRKTIALCRKFFRENQHMDHPHVKIMGKLSFLKYRMIFVEFL